MSHIQLNLDLMTSQIGDKLIKLELFIDPRQSETYL